MQKVKILSTQWLPKKKSILCKVEGGTEALDDRDIIIIEPEVFGMDSKNLTYEQEKKFKKFSKMLVGKNLSVDVM